MPDETKPRVGRKRHAPTQGMRDRVMVMIAAGLTQTETGEVLGLNRSTLDKYYRKEIDFGYASLHGRIAGRLIAKADNGDLAAQMFFLERRCGWTRRDNVALENANNVPLAFTFRWADAPEENEQPPKPIE